LDGYLALHPYERECREKFHLLEGQLYRYHSGEHWLSPCTSLGPLAEFCRVHGETLLHASAVKMRPAAERAEQCFDIAVQTLTGQSFHYTVHSDTTVEQLNLMIQEVQGKR
jgi:hypothetical protein